MQSHSIAGNRSAWHELNMSCYVSAARPRALFLPPNPAIIPLLATEGAGAHHMLTIDGCRARRRRFQALLEKQNLDGALVTLREHVYYFTGYLSHWNHAPAAFIDRRGRLTLVGYNLNAEKISADDIITYPAHKMATMPSDQALIAAPFIEKVLPAGRRLGVDGEGPHAFGRLCGPDAVNITPSILQLRKKKDADEIVCLKRVLAVTDAMYAHAKAALAPGLDELELFAQLRAVATRAADGDLEIFGNDFRSNAAGGAARRRPMEDGELYVLDPGPSLNGYHADNCRTFAVNRKPTGVQHKAWQKIVDCLAMLEGQVKPGVTGAALFKLAKEFLADAGHSGMVHHLGHGIGLQPHESPQLNPEFDAVVEAGDVITMEPGLYSPELRAGIRLEQNYIVTAKGAERITTFPLDLA